MGRLFPGMELGRVAHEFSVAYREPLRYHVLGPVTAVAGGTAASLGGAKQRLVLALLVVDVGSVVSDDRLVAALWGDQPAATARHTLRTYVSGLRGVLDDDVVRTSGGYRLVADSDAVDLRRFEHLVAAGVARLGDAPHSAGELLREALALWRGEPFGDLATTPVLEPVVRHLHEARLTAVERRIEADLACGHHRAAALELEPLVREHPYRERLRELLMLALYRSGRQAEALAVYDTGRRRLSDDLGIDPSPTLQALHDAILRQDARLIIDAASAPVPVAEAAMPVVRGVELRARIWDGPISSVYRGYQASNSQEVALKLIHPPLASRPAFIQAFEPWAARLRQVDHPHLVPLLDAWREPDGARLVSPWVHGNSVASALRDGAWTAERALQVVPQMAAALAALHAHGLSHGAVAARHVLIDRDGRALLADPSVPIAVPRGPHGAGGRNVHTVANDIRDLALLVIELLVGVRADPRDPLRLLATRGDVPVDVIEVLGEATGWTGGTPPADVDQLLARLRRVTGTSTVGPIGADTRSAVDLRSPYKGLRAFDERDADDFFGRDELVAQLVDAVERNRLVTVVGPSGSGKSSVVKAGLVPALRRGAIAGSERWFVVGFTPGSHPFEELAHALESVATEPLPALVDDMLADGQGLMRATTRALPGLDNELVVVVDQLEELFTLTPDDLRGRFIDGLAALATAPDSRARVMLTLRADYFDRPLEHPALGGLLRRGLVPVAVPTADALAHCVEEPARRVGVTFEQGLVARIVADVGAQPGGLPLLQHTLTDLFARRESGVLTAAAYTELGGVSGAVGRRAEDVYQALSPGAREIAADVLLRLVRIDPAGEPARLRVLRSHLLALPFTAAHVDEVLRMFGAGRLLAFDRDPLTRSPTVEVAHEAVFGSWPRLAGWIEDRRTDLAEHQRLIAALEEWAASGRGDDDLLPESRLTRFERLATDGAVVLSAEERSFLDNSREGVRRRRSRRRRLVTAVATVVALLVTVGGALAAYGAGERARAEAGERIATARRLATLSRQQQSVDHDVAVLLALESVAATRSAGEPAIQEAVEALHEAVAAHREVALVEDGGMGVALAGDSGHLLTAGPPTFTPRLHHWADPSQSSTPLAKAGNVPALWPVASADGRFIAESYEDAPPVVWDASTGEVIAQLDAIDPPTRSPAFSADGDLIAVLADVAEDDARRAGRTVVVWDLVAGSERHRAALDESAHAIALSPDGSLVAVVEEDGVVLVDPATGQRRELEDAADGIPVHVAFDPTGRDLAVLRTIPGRVTVHDVDSGAVRLALPSGSDTLVVCYAADGSFLAASAADGVRVWDAATGDLRLRLPAGRVSRASCGHKDTVAVPHVDGAVRIYNVGPAGGSEVLAAPVPPTFAAKYAPDGSIIATGRDGHVRRLDARTGAVVADSGPVLPGPSPWLPAISPDGRFVAVRAPSTDGGRAGDPLVTLLDAATLDRVRALPWSGTPIGFDAAGRRLLVGGASGTVQVLDTATGESIVQIPVEAPPATPPIVEDGALTPDGRFALLQSAVAPTVWIWDVDKRRLAVELATTDVGGRLDLSPHGRRLALLGRGDAVEVLDMERLLRKVDGPTRAMSVEQVRLSTFVAPGFTGLEFDPTGELVATAGFDGTLGIYNATSGDRLFTVDHQGLTAGASFSPDGRHVIAAVSQGGGMHAVRAYTTDVDELAEIAHAKLLRDLTDAECLRFLGQAQCSSA